MLRLSTQIMSTLNKSMHARQISGKPVMSQLREMLVLYYSKGKLRPSEYFDYGLYDDRSFSRADKAQFLGTRAMRQLYAVNDSHYRGIADDKMIFFVLMRGLGVQTPEVYAIYSPGNRALDGIPCLSKPSALENFLLTKIPYPFFAKPIMGNNGRGAFAVESCDRAAKTVALRSGEIVRVHDFVTNLTERDRRGYLFQRCLGPHPVLREICGNSLSTVRVVVKLSDHGPRAISAAWRIPRRLSVTDNFTHGTSGNLLGRFDLDTGSVLEVINGIGFDRSTVSVHPDTGTPLTGIQLPDWQAALRICLAAAHSLPGLRFQHWDIALSSDGPAIIEVNAHGNWDLVQNAARAGFLRWI